MSKETNAFLHSKAKQWCVLMSLPLALPLLGAVFSLFFFLIANNLLAPDLHNEGALLGKYIRGFLYNACIILSTAGRMLYLGVTLFGITYIVYFVIYGFALREHCMRNVELHLALFPVLYSLFAVIAAFLQQGASLDGWNPQQLFIMTLAYSGFIASFGYALYWRWQQLAANR